jgi:hypothetical protein
MGSVLGNEYFYEWGQSLEMSIFMSKWGPRMVKFHPSSLGIEVIVATRKIPC